VNGNTAVAGARRNLRSTYSRIASLAVRSTGYMRVNQQFAAELYVIARLRITIQVSAYHGYAVFLWPRSFATSVIETRSGFFTTSPFHHQRF
jgi:hypothetical protein